MCQQGVYQIHGQQRAGVKKPALGGLGELMTVIAWDGRELAADKMSADEWTVRRVTKLRRIRGDEAIAGAAGDADRCRALLQWLDAGGEFPPHLRAAESAQATALVVWRDGRIELYQREPEPIKLDPGPQAIGSGAEAALVAMACGRSASDAVLLAARFCRGVGQGVDALTFSSSGAVQLDV